MHLVALFLMTWLQWTGCRKGAPPAPAYYEYDGAPSAGMDYDREESAKADSGGGGFGGLLGGSVSGKKPPPPPPPPPPAVDAPALEPAPTEPNAPTAATPAAARMVHYDGWMQLRVANPRETLEAAIKLVEGLGGRTERMQGNVVTLRVPVEKFDAGWKELLLLGDVVNKSIRADDVTEAFTAMDLRAATLRATQTRLVALLAKAKDEQEKLMLLTELTRVSTELDSLESQLRTLSDLAAMSRVTLEAVPREAFQAQGGRPALAGFEWIAALSPFRRSIWADDHRVDLSVPEGLVSLSTKGPFVAESADGTVLWTLRVGNDPVGSSAFWISTIQDRVAQEFASPLPSHVGSWDCISLDEPGADEPYRWQICVRTAGNKLEVAQVFYPGKAQVERYGQAIEAVLGKGGES